MTIPKGSVPNCKPWQYEGHCLWVSNFNIQREKRTWIKSKSYSMLADNSLIGSLSVGGLYTKHFFKRPQLPSMAWHSHARTYTKRIVQFDHNICSPGRLRSASNRLFSTKTSPFSIFRALSFCFRQSPGWIPWTAYRVEHTVQNRSSLSTSSPFQAAVHGWHQ